MKQYLKMFNFFSYKPDKKRKAYFQILNYINKLYFTVFK